MRDTLTDMSMCDGVKLSTAFYSDGDTARRASRYSQKELAFWSERYARVHTTSKREKIYRHQPRKGEEVRRNLAKWRREMYEGMIREIRGER